MKMGFFLWCVLMVQLPWSDSLENQIVKPLDLSLSVNCMWTKRNDHATKNECADFFNLCPKIENLKKMEV